VVGIIDTIVLVDKENILFHASLVT